MAKSGIVKKFFFEKGFGFIARSGEEDLFIHVKDIRGREALAEGDHVVFDTWYNDRTGKWNAGNCQKTGGSGPGADGFGAQKADSSKSSRAAPYDTTQVVPPRPGFRSPAIEQAITAYQHATAEGYAAAAAEHLTAMGVDVASVAPEEQLSLQVQLMAASQLTGVTGVQGWGEYAGASSDVGYSAASGGGFLVSGHSSLEALMGAVGQGSAASGEVSAAHGQQAAAIAAASARSSADAEAQEAMVKANTLNGSVREDQSEVQALWAFLGSLPGKKPQDGVALGQTH